MQETTAMKALIIVVNSGHANDVIEIARGAGVRGATILPCRGAGTSAEALFGISIDANKEMLICIADGPTAERAMTAIAEKAGIKTPAHSFCFVIPVEKTLGITA